MHANTHTDDCVHPPYYDGPEDCAPNLGVWNQPPGSFASDAQQEFEDDVPWCRVRNRAFELQTVDEFGETVCARCGAENPEDEPGSVPTDWEALTDHRGEAVGVICPDCITPEEQQAIDDQAMSLAEQGVTA